jgi:hypothetical protein
MNQPCEVPCSYRVDVLTISPEVRNVTYPILFQRGVDTVNERPSVREQSEPVRFASRLEDVLHMSTILL